MLHDGHTHDHDHHNCDCEESHKHYDEESMDVEETIITMVDAETNEEYKFVLADEFDYKGNVYYVLVTEDDEDPELVITKVADMDGEEALMSLDEEEADEIYAEYDRLCEDLEQEEDENDTESEI